MSRHAERLNPQRAALNTRRINLFLPPGRRSQTIVSSIVGVRVICSQALFHAILHTPFIITHTHVHMCIGRDEVADWYFASAACLLMAPICHSECARSCSEIQTASDAVFACLYLSPRQYVLSRCACPWDAKRSFVFAAPRSILSAYIVS
jgi:hypothetical protein